MVMALTMMPSLSFADVTADGTAMSWLMVAGAVKNVGHTLKWSKVSGAEGYDIFYANCGGTYKKAKTVKAGSKLSYTKKKLNNKNSYKWTVKAYKTVSGKKCYIAKSLTVHLAGKKYKRSNATAVKVSKKKAEIKIGETFKLVSKISAKSSKKIVLTKGHAAAIRYLTSDKSIATVSNSGNISAKSKGKCYIYAVAPSGVYAKTEVTVVASEASAEPIITPAIGPTGPTGPTGHVCSVYKINRTNGSWTCTDASCGKLLEGTQLAYCTVLTKNKRPNDTNPSDGGQPQNIISLEDDCSENIGYGKITVSGDNVTYTNTSGRAQTVVIRTTSPSTNLIIDAPKDVIEHYDMSGTLKIINTATESFHEYGDVTFAEIAKGRIALESGSEVERLHFDATTKKDFDQIIVAADPSVTLPKFSRDKAEITTNGILVVELQDDTNNDELTDSNYIWLYKQGVISQIVVVDEAIEGIEKKDDKFVATDNNSKEVVLGVSENAAKTKKAAYEIANNYKGTNTDGTITIEKEVVDLPKLDSNGDLEDKDGSKVEDTGLTEDKKTEEISKTVEEAIEKMPVAVVNGTEYASLSDVAKDINSGKITEATIVLNKNLTIAFDTQNYFNISKGQKITLDLNGHTIESYATRNGGASLINNAGELLLKDSTAGISTVGKGKITLNGVNPDHKDVPGYASNLLTNSGTLTVESGFYENVTRNNPSYATYALDIRGGSNVTINGGKIVQNAERTYAMRIFADSTLANVNINGGYIEGGYGLWLQHPNTNPNKVNLKINGGEFTGHDGFSVYCSGSYSTEDFSNTTIEVTGGKFNDNGLSINYTIAPSGDSHISVTGGTTTAAGMPYLARELSSDYAMKLNKDGTYTVAKKSSLTKSELDAYYAKMDELSYCKVGDTYHTSLSRAIVSAKDGDTITILKDFKSTSALSLENKTLTLDLNGHSFDCSAQSFCYVYGGDWTLTSSKEGARITVDYGAKSAYAVYVLGGHVTIENIDITSNYMSVMTNAAGALVEIKSGNFNGPYPAYSYAGTISCTGGTYTGSVYSSTLAPGYCFVENADGSNTVQRAAYALYYYYTPATGDPYYLTDLFATKADADESYDAYSKLESVSELEEYEIKAIAQYDYSGKTYTEYFDSLANANTYKADFEGAYGEGAYNIRVIEW